MRLKYKWIFTLLVALSMQFSFAQEKTVTGTVSDDAGVLPLANIFVKGTKRSAQTDMDGKYAIKTKIGEELVFSYVGLKDMSIKVGPSNVINAVLMADTEGEKLNEIVITGQGIKKEKKALGYAVTTIKAEEFASKPSTDIARALTGKAPGVNIAQTSGMSGSGTNINIRGKSSISGSNQPLFVVDGIPFNTDTNSDDNFVGGATNASSRFLDLDPNSIESVSILKGLSATTLYGSAGRNGVILVTTKSGNTKDLNKKMQITFTQSLYTTQISDLPDLQFKYGNGFNNTYQKAFSNWGPEFGTIGTQGIDKDGLIDHWYKDNSAEYANLKVPYKPYNNVKPFFNTGFVSTSSISIGGRSENTTYNVSVGNTSDEGFIENNIYRRFNINMGGQTKLNNGFTISSTMNYVKTDKTSPPTGISLGSGGPAPGAFATIFYTPISFDLWGLPFENPVTNESWNYRKDIPNPRWTLKNSSDDEGVRRFFGNAAVTYDINSWSNVSYRMTLDNYTQNKKYYVNKGNGQSFYNDGYLRTTIRESTIFDHTASYNFDTKIDKSNNFNLDGTLGLNSRLESSNLNYLDSSEQSIYGLLEHQYFKSSYNESSRRSLNINALYGSATLGYKKYLYLNFSARNDWFSSLQPKFRSLFYPSTSLSFVPTDAFKILKDNKYVNYMKMRIGYGTSAGFPDPYQTVVGLALATRSYVEDNGNVLNQIYPARNGGNFGQSLLGNLNLKPELLKELEFGFEGKFFQNRIGIDLSIYDKRSKDLIIEQELAPENGSEVTASNIAEVSNKGIELALNLSIIKPKTDGLSWDLTAQFTKNTNIIESLGNSKSLRIAGFGFLGNFAEAGQPYGVIKSNSIQRDGNGNFIVANDGNYLINDELTIVGDPNADWRSTLISDIGFKGVSFGFQFEYTKGGDMYSATAASLLSRGITKDTSYDRSGTVVLPGVKQNGQINDIQIGYTQYGFNNNGFFIREQAIYDATNLRLREISLSYSLPKKYLEKTPFGKISMSIVGQNLWYKAFNFPTHLNFDPEVSSTGVGNGSGFDFFTGPTNKRIGFNFNLTF